MIYFAQEDTRSNIDQFTDWLQDVAPSVLAVLAAVWVINRFSDRFVSHVVKNAIKKSGVDFEDTSDQRSNTIVSIITTSIRILVWIVAGMIILSSLGFDIAPLVASAGVAGFALGFGAQSLVKDFISGLFIIIENQYRVGDVVTINDISGTVEEITMRATVLRDLDGHQHHIGNGTIEMATNKSMEYSAINLDIGVGYAEDIDEVEKVINQVGQAMAKDKDWTDLIVDAPEFLRVDDLGDNAVVIKIHGKAKPGQQWKVHGELRRRIKKAFDESQIEIPFPQRVVHESKSKKK